MDVLGIRFVGKRTKREFAVRALHRRLIVFRVVRNTAVSKEIALIVLVSEVLRAVHQQILRTETRIQREENLLGDVHRISRSDSLRELHVIAVADSQIAVRHLLLGDSVKPVKKIMRRFAATVAHPVPDSIIKMLRERFSDKTKYLASRRRRLLPVALRGTSAEKRGNRRVRFKLSNHRAEERLQGPEVELKIKVLAARRRVRSKLRRSVKRADRLLVTDTRSAGHKLESLLAPDKRKTEEVRAVLARRVLVFVKRKRKFTCHK